VVPRSIVHFGLGGFHLYGPRAHVQQQVQTPIQKFNSRSVTDLRVFLAASSIFTLLRFSMSEQDESVGLGCTEIKRYGPHPLGVPLGETDVGLRSLKGNRVQCCHVLTPVGHLTLYLHLWVQEPSHPRQFQTDVIVLVHHLCWRGEVSGYSFMWLKMSNPNEKV
uniref:Uncharacterized protein n=1 Tax=Nothobranchius furzeri TaxID=105023 RepID=A0A8C6NZV5_NOTFU